MTAWFRMYSELLNDPKIQSLSLEAFKTYINSLCLACQVNSKDGNIGTLQDVTWALRVTKSSVTSALQELEKNGLVVTDNETLHIVTWQKRQYKSDTSAERVRKHREKKKRYSNVTCNGPDTDTDTDKKTKAKKVSYSGKFEEVWNIKPRDRDPNKKRAYEVYRKLSPDEQKLILTALPLWRKQNRETEEGFRPHLVNWLKGRCWEEFEQEKITPLKPTVKIERHSEQHRAWDAHKKAHGEKSLWFAGDYAYPPTEWPPQKEKAV